MRTRTPYDGEPYYCAVCGLGIAEFYACEEPDCRLETVEDALNRLKAAITDGETKRRTDEPPPGSRPDPPGGFAGGGFAEGAGAPGR